MHVPANMKMGSVEKMHQFIRQFSFGCMMTSDFNATHLPFLLDEKNTENGALLSHLARANPHWKTLHNAKVLIVFQGPHSYISPTWYESSPAVPTWNYSAVHVEGVVNCLSEEETAKVLSQTLDTYEPTLRAKDTEEDHAYQARLRSAIVGIKVNIHKIVGKQKLGLHKSEGDQRGVYKHLKESTSLDQQALAEYMTAQGFTKHL